MATKVDPETGADGGDTLAALDTADGHQDLGLYARVIEGGAIAIGQDWRPA